MKLDFSQQLKDFRDDSDLELPRSDGTSRKLTLGVACGEALITPSQEPARSMENWLLAVRLYKGGEQEITPEEAAAIKLSINKHFSSDIVRGQCAQMLNG